MRTHCALWGGSSLCLPAGSPDTNFVQENKPFENHIDYFREPVVKSPPEPTRVKSPEAVVRSPDPINWTVPLDTGKTFSVTQSVKDGGDYFFHHIRDELLMSFSSRFVEAQSHERSFQQPF